MYRVWIALFSVLHVIALPAYTKQEPAKDVPAIYTQGGGLVPDKVVAFKQSDSKPLTLDVFYPDTFKPGDTRPAIVFFFGGGWTGGDPNQFYPQAAYLASRGMVGISAHYRTKSRDGAEPFQCVEDGKSAIRYMRLHAKELGINPEKLACGGGSAGGHVAAATATIKSYDCPDDDLSVSAVPNALVLFNPVYDNGPQGYGYERVKDYYQTISPLHNLDGTQPPTLVLFGSRDKYIPVETATLYDARMEANGNRCDTVIYEGQQHGFFNMREPNHSEYFIKTVSEMDRFLVSLGYLSGPPTVENWLASQEGKSAEYVRLCLKTPSAARERAFFLPGKDGEAGDIGFIVDGAGRSQANNSGCLDPPVNERVQEKGPLEARSSFQTEPRPRVLLIGDSISIGYLDSARERLKGKAQVYGLPIATTFSTQGLKEIDRHLAKMPWNVIHFNWGLNDLEHFGTGKRRVPLDRYEKNLTRLVDKLEKTGAVLIWATTTPIPKGTDSRTHGDAVQYNTVAANVMQGRDIRINDLYSFALARLADIQKPADVHYTVNGYAVLGGEVARSVQLALAAAAGQSSKPRSIDVGLQKQLLVDDYVISEKQNITREMGKPRKFGVVMEATVPTDFHPTRQFPDGLPESGYSGIGYRTTVLWNEQQEIFQMLYRASAENLTAYAESIDGINWTKPFITDDGKSNLITYRGKTRGTFYEASFTIDPTVPWSHPEKYKAAYNPGDPWDSEAAIAHSSDGIHWKGYNEGAPVTGRAADTHNQILWDPIDSRYLLLTRTDLGAGGGKKEVRATRIMAHDKGNDLLSYPKAWKTLATVTVDDPQGKKTSSGVTAVQMEAMNIWVHENVYFGLMHVLTAGDLMGGGGGKDQDLDARHETDVIDFYIGTSRDAVNFDKSWVHARKPLIERGQAGSFDKDMLSATSEILTRGDEHWIYYQGDDRQHHGRRPAGSKGGRIGLAKLPLDRFVCQQAKDKLGTITTKPFKLEGDALQVNVDAEGRFYAEVLDADGQAIPGFTVNEAKLFNGVDELRLEPQWKNNKDLSSLKGKTIRLKFYLYNAKLYAFQILPGCQEKQTFDPYGVAGKTHFAVTPEDRTGSAWWLARHQQVLERITKGNIDLIMVGDSITHNWDNTGKKVWDQYYVSRNAVNFGFGGDGTESVIWRFDNGEIDGINPKLAVLMIGTNNSNGDDHTPEEIADGIKAICTRMRAKMPKTKILILAIFPRGFGSDEQREALGHSTTFNPQWAKNDQASRIASRIADDKHIFYLDINEAFLDEKGFLTREVMPDFVHLSEKGYRLWAEALEPTIDKLMGDP